MNMTTTSPLLIDALSPWTTTLSERRKAALQIAFGVAFLTLLAQLRIPIGPVPFTGQTLAVLLLGAAYGSRMGALTAAVYVVGGALGLPMFQGWQGGFAHLAGPTGGYLLAFPLAAATVGLFAQRGWDRKPVLTALAMLVGNAVIFVPGLLWLDTFMPSFSHTLSVGLLPFIPGDLVKIAISMALLPSAWAMLQKR